MAGQKGMRPAPESRGGDHPAGRRTGITDRGGIIMPMIPPLSYRPPKAAVQGVLMRERGQPPPLADAFMLCAHQTMPSPHGRARRGDGEERQIERGGPALRLGGDGRREQCKADDGVDGFSDGLHGGLLFLRCPRHASRRRRGRRTDRDEHRTRGLPSVLQAPDERLNGHAAPTDPFLHGAGASAHGRFRSLIHNAIHASGRHSRNA